MYDSGEMEFDGDQGSGMGGMADANDIFRMFFGGGMGGFSSMGGMGGRGGQSFTFKFG